MLKSMTEEKGKKIVAGGEKIWTPGAVKGNGTQQWGKAGGRREHSGRQERGK